MDIALDRARLGERWVLRCRLADGSATDVVGWLVSLDDLGVALEVEGGDSVAVDRSAIILARRAPSGPPSRGGWRTASRSGSGPCGRAAVSPAGPTPRWRSAIPAFRGPRPRRG